MPPAQRAELFRIMAGVFLVVFSIRLALVLMVAPEIPYYDEWDAVIDGMARPMLAGQFSFQYLLTPHNEHPMLWTKAVAYLLLRAGDLQFDNVPVCEVSQFVYAAIAAALIALAATRLTAMDGVNAPNAGSGLRPTRDGSWFAACAGIAAALPYGWENIGMGFGNSYYFLTGFSVGTILLASVVRGSARGVILLGIIAAASGVSMASGLFAPIAAILALMLRTRIGSVTARAATRGAAVLLVALASAVALVMRADRVALEWGFVQSAELALLALLLLPTWMLLARVWRGRGTDADVACVCISAWGCAQVCAILLGRPAFRLWYPISRYFDILTVMAFANVGCLLRLAMAEPARRKWIRLARAILVATVAALLAFAPFAWHWMSVRAGSEQEQAGRIARYIHAGDAGAIDAARAGELPYPDRARLRRLLDAADVRVILGDVAGTRAAPSAFVEKVRGVNAGLARNGAWLLPLAVAAGMLILLRARRRDTIER